MADLSAQMADALNRASALYGETVTYTRGALTASIAALVEQPEMMSVDEEITVTAEGLNFLILVSELVDFSDPQRGDTVTYGGNVYEVLNTPGIGVFEYTDAGQNAVRVRTKRKE